MRFFRRLASFARLILFDKRGLGVSDRPSGWPTLEERMDDMRAVMDAAGSQVAAAARPGEVLVSSTVRDLVAGSGLPFQDRGVHALKGVPGEWRLLAVGAD